jgi:hypothetical protein
MRFGIGIKAKGDGINFVIVVLLFAVTHCVSSIIDVTFMG